MNTETDEKSYGYLTVHVTTARGAIPLEGARVTVSSYGANGSPERAEVLAALTTDRDGNTARIRLPAPALRDSLSPRTALPYTTYNLDVRLEGYRTQHYLALPIFEGVTAIQPADMIPLPENGSTDPYLPEEDRFFETSPTEL